MGWALSKITHSNSPGKYIKGPWSTPFGEPIIDQSSIKVHRKIVRCLPKSSMEVPLDIFKQINKMDWVQLLSMLFNLPTLQSDPTSFTAHGSHKQPKPVLPIQTSGQPLLTSMPVFFMKFPTESKNGLGRIEHTHYPQWSTQPTAAET